MARIILPDKIDYKVKIRNIDEDYKKKYKKVVEETNEKIRINQIRKAEGAIKAKKFVAKSRSLKRK